jgi:hypothetical protein
MSAQFEILIDRIDRFIRRYYLNRLIKGGVLFVAGFILLLMVFAALEYVGYFGRAMRLMLFYAFIAFNLFVLIRYVIIPLLGMLRIGRRIGPEQAAVLLGKHFPEEVNDRITNTLQLKHFLDDQAGNTSLILAAVEQKASQANRVPFQNAINLKGNVRLLPFVIVPLIVAFAIYLIAPAFLIEPARRIVRYEQHFERPMPFTFSMESPALGFRNENLEVVMRCHGPVWPDDAVIRYGDGRFMMQKGKEGVFTHLIRNLQHDMSFYVEAGGYRFGPFVIEVVQKPGIVHFSVKIEYPAYTGLPGEQHHNLGDISVIRGTQVSWEFNTQGSGDIVFSTKSTAEGASRQAEVEEIRDGVFAVQTRAMESFSYQVLAYDEKHGRGDSLLYNVQVRPDAYPFIRAEVMQDSVLLAHLFHQGDISDDFGFTSLDFLYRIKRENETARDNVVYEIEEIPVDRNMKNQRFYHHLDLGGLGLRPGQGLEYFFVVYDNDAVSGPKSSRSHMFSYQLPTREELIAQSRRSDEEIKQDLGQGKGQVNEAQDDIEALRRQLLESDRFSWEQREELRQLLNKQEDMEKRMQELSDKKRDSELRDEQFRDVNERIREKQEELQRIFDEVMSDEMKELFDKIREELDKLDRNQVYDMLEQMAFEMSELETQMDRALELFRQLEMEKLLQESISMLDELSEQQEELRQESQDGAANNGEERQEAINKAYDDVQELIEQFREKNQELMRPRSIDDTSQQEEGIKMELDKALEQMKQQDGKKASPHQENASQQMKELSQQLQDMQMDMFMEQLAEDARNLREIMENLLRTSFAQEDLMLEVQQVNVNDPAYLEMIQRQRKIKDDMDMIGDSLVALSKRQAQISSFVTRELAEVQMNINRSLELLVARSRMQGAGRQQFAMTHINNLALLLNESLQNMQMQMAMMEGSGDGEGQGQGQGGRPQPSFQNMSQMQEQLNEMLKQMQQGGTPEMGQPGMSPGQMSEAMYRMAAEQQKIREELGRMADKMQSEGMGEQQELQDLQRDMERTELDIVRKQINRQTIQRQERIMTRLLEHEKAELQREMEEEREGTTAIEYPRSSPEALMEELLRREQTTEMLRRIPPALRPYYREMVEKYLIRLQEGAGD